MTTDPIPSHQDQPANRAAYEKLESALREWRATVELKFSNSATCAHEWQDRSGVQVCKHCGQPMKLAEMEKDSPLTT